MPRLRLEAEGTPRAPPQPEEQSGCGPAAGLCFLLCRGVICHQKYLPVTKFLVVPPTDQDQLRRPSSWAMNPFMKPEDTNTTHQLTRTEPAGWASCVCEQSGFMCSYLLVIVLVSTQTAGSPRSPRLCLHGKGSGEGHTGRCLFIGAIWVEL